MRLQMFKRFWLCMLFSSAAIMAVLFPAEVVIVKIYEELKRIIDSEFY